MIPTQACHNQLVGGVQRQAARANKRVRVGQFRAPFGSSIGATEWKTAAILSGVLASNTQASRTSGDRSAAEEAAMAVSIEGENWVRDRCPAAPPAPDVPGAAPGAGRLEQSLGYRLQAVSAVRKHPSSR